MKTGILDLRPACAALSAVVSGTRDDQLGGSTPCPAYTVADLLDHVDGLALAFTAAATRHPLPGAPAAPEVDGSRLGADWRPRILARLDALAAAWQDPAAYDGLTMAGPVELPAEVAVLVALDEVVVHGWDLARATAQPYGTDPWAVEACLSFAASFEPAADGAADGGLFGPPVAVPLTAPAGPTGRGHRSRSSVVARLIAAGRRRPDFPASAPLRYIPRRWRVRAA